MERKERGFIGRVVVFLLSVLAVIGLVAMMLCALCPYVNPSRFVWLAFFGLSFWEILAFNVVVFMLLLLMWSRKVWIAVLALVLAVPGFKKSFSFGSKVDAAQSFKVMSYNVHFFSHFDGQTNRDDYVNQIINTVREQSPDLLCIQEFVTYNYRLKYRGCVEDFAQRTGLPYVYHNTKGRATNVIFSKYPIAKVADGTGFDKEDSFGVMVSVDAGERGRFYLANIHLISYMVTPEEIDVLVNPSEQRNVLDTIGLSVARKLKLAYEKRGDEIGEMLQSIPKVDAPVVVCGDFNDTPMSYVYRQMQKAGFIDTFTKVGHGIKPTYAGRLPLLRIDYMWGNDKVTPLRFTRCHRKASDHYPIILDFAIQ